IDQFGERSGTCHRPDRIGRERARAAAEDNRPTLQRWSRIVDAEKRAGPFGTGSLLLTILVKTYTCAKADDTAAARPRINQENTGIGRKEPDGLTLNGGQFARANASRKSGLFVYYYHSLSKK
ncbi:MAG TPA: hypothetical protein VGL24_03670, partial [Chthoniobacterales bacterium]